MVDNDYREQIKKIALAYADHIKKEYKIQSLYIFGSSAKGYYNEDSDIDIAVVAENFSGDIVEDIFRLMKLRRNIDARIEPHPFLADEFNMNNPNAYEIIETGIRII